MMAIPLVKKAYNSPWWIPALSIVAVLSLAGTLVLSLLFAVDQRDERQRSRDTDAVFCNRANDLRRQVVGIGEANEAMVQGIIDIVLPPDAVNGERAAAIARIRAELEPVFVKHRAAIAEVRLIDCSALPSANPQENP
jgi:hypothetical protein